MAHKTKIVEYKRLSNEQFAVRIRCCDHEGTDHWHTMAFVHDPTQRAANLEKVRDLVAQRHESEKQTEAEFTALVGHEKEHE